MSAIRGVLFDVDGTLVDSNDAHARAWVIALGEAGFDVPFQRVREMIGMGGDKILPDITGLKSDNPEAKAIGERTSVVFKERFLPHLEPFPDVRPLLERMRDDGLALFIATSAKQDELQSLLKVAHVADLFDAEASKKDARHSKPDPDIIEAAVGKSGLRPEQLVMIGDTPYDVEAAGRAKVRSIAFRCGGWPDDKLKGATLVYDGAWDMLDNYASFERSFK